MDYIDFIASKQTKAVDAGYFQECGLGKTIQQLCFADETRKHTGEPSIILAPLAVANQTKRQGEAFGIEVNICESQRM